MDQHEIVHQLPALDKTALIIGDDFGEDPFQPIGYHFSYDFISNITKRNWAKSAECIFSFLFGDESEKR